jgi:hypothetical protein
MTRIEGSPILGAIQVLARFRQ